MDSVPLLKRMIKVSAQVALEVRGEKASVELCEPQAPDSKLRIRGIPADAIVIQMDSFPAPDAVTVRTLPQRKQPNTRQT